LGVRDQVKGFRDYDLGIRVYGVRLGIRISCEAGASWCWCRVYGLQFTVQGLAIRVQGFYLTQSVFKFVLQKSTPPQIRQLILYYHYVDEFEWELTFAKRL